MNLHDHDTTESNPLIDAIDTRLAQVTGISPLAGELKEGELLLWLRAEGWVQEDLPDRALYQVHFLMRNALYRLLPEYPDLNWQVDALGVRWQAWQDQSAPGLIAGQSTDVLADYYLDWSNFNLSDASVQRLLDSFWRRYAGLSTETELAPALAALGLKQLPADLGSLKQHYRRRVAKVHPDKGGAAADTAEVQRLNEAYARLKLFLKAKAL